MVVIFALLAAALFSRRRWQLDETLLTAFALWAALSHARFMFFAGLILAPILRHSLKLFPPYERELDKPWLNAAIMAAIVAAMVYFYPSEAAANSRRWTKATPGALWNSCSGSTSMEGSSIAMGGADTWNGMPRN